MTTPIFALTDWAAAQASPWIGHNQALRVIEGLLQGNVLDRDLTAPPGACGDGAAYLVDTPATGAWAGHGGELAVAVGVNAASGWLFADVEREGFLLFVDDENVRLEYRSDLSPAGWIEFTTGSGGGIPDAPNDGELYARRNLAWEAFEPGSGGGGGGGVGPHAAVNLTGADPWYDKSYNVSSVTRTAAGRFRITFAVPFDDTSYIVSGTGQFPPFADNNHPNLGIDRQGDKATDYCDIITTENAANSAGDIAISILFQQFDETVGIGAGAPASVVAETGTAVDLDPLNSGKYVRFTDAGTKTLTVRDEADVAYPTNGEWHVRNAGAGDLTIAEDTAVTVNPPAGGTLVVAEGGTVTLKRVAADEWDLLGQTVPV